MDCIDDGEPVARSQHSPLRLKYRTKPVSLAAEITEYLALRRLPDFDGLTRLVVKPLKSDTPATETIRRARPGDLLKPCRVGVVVS